VLSALSLAAAPVAIACGDDDSGIDTDEVQESVEDVAEEAGETADEAQARATAEALRAALANSDIGADEGLRSIDAIEEAIDSLPGDPDISGVEDGSGDGMDDDGRVQVDVDDAAACMIIPDAADDSTQDDGDDGTTERMGDIDVEGGEC
jgi:hypothetical protein